jgi:quercetin dioxygenase-like cupin family protein
MNEGYEVVHVDELEELPIANPNGAFVLRPVRRRFGITAFGTNAYTGDAGQRVIEEHFERDNHQEMYVVLRGRATFTLGDDEVDAPAGTIVYAQPGTRRGAVAAENGTPCWRSGRSRESSSSPRPGRTSSSRTPTRTRETSRVRAP